MQKIILKENSEKQQQVINDIQSFCSKMNEVLSDFIGSTGYTPTKRELETLMNGGLPESMSESITLTIEAQLNKTPGSNIMYKSMREGLKEQVYKSISGTSKKLIMIGYGKAKDYFFNLSLKDGKIFLSKETEEQIRESFRVSIASEAGKEFWEKHQNAVNVLNDLSLYVREKTLIRAVNIHQFAGTLFSLNNETGEIVSYGVDYDRATKK
jgi:hypothetical protein